MVLNANKLKAKIVEAGLTQKQVASAIGVTPRTFSTRLKTGIFGSDEISKITKLLNIDNPLEIFFDKW